MQEGIRFPTFLLSSFASFRLLCYFLLSPYLRSSAVKSLCPSALCALCGLCGKFVPRIRVDPLPKGVADARRCQWAYWIFQRFRMNNFPGNCLTSPFISRLNNATDTAELGNPALGMTSSWVIPS